MKILFVVPYIPNLIRVRPYNLLRTLAARGHEITLLTLWSETAEQNDITALKEICHQVHALPMPKWRSLLNCLIALPQRAPLQSVFSWLPDLVEGMNNNVPFDVVHVEHLRGVRYALHLKEHTNLPVVWDSVDCITHLFEQTVEQSTDRIRRWRSQLDLKRTAVYEGWLVQQFDEVLVTSPTDQSALVHLSGRSHEELPIHVVANGVDLDYFQPKTAVTREPATLVISGKMSYHANITMALHLTQNIMPHIWAARPDVKLWIVGKDPTSEIVALAENPNVTVTGFVEDIRPYLQQATIAVAPLTYGAGVQNKVLEAMACATPVITTLQAISALQIEAGQDVLVADQPEQFAQTILNLLNNPQQQEQVGQAGYRYVHTHHHWPNIVARLENIYQNAIHNRQNHHAAPA